MLNFTDLAVRSLSEGYHWDEKVAGFGIRVGKNRKTWLVVKGKNRTKITLGHYPSLSLQDARKKALVEIGSPTASRSAPTFPDALNAFLTQDRWKPSSKYQITRTLRRHFDWTRTLDKITHEDVAQAIEKIDATSHLSATGNRPA